VTATTLGLTVFGTLTVSGVLHLTRQPAFRAVMREQRLVPERLVVPVSGAVTAAELVVGTTGVASSGFGAVGGRMVAVAGAAIFAVFTAYTAALLRRGGSVPCGCTGDDVPVSAWAVARAAALTAASIAAAIGALTPLTNLAPAEACVAAVAATTFATLLWIFPDALFDPMQMPLVRRALEL
jgi:hypothetical protein